MADNETGAIPVPAEVLEGLELVRASGLTNMLDYIRVAELAEGLLCSPRTADWVREHRALYCAGIFRGFLAQAQAEPHTDSDVA